MASPIGRYFVPWRMHVPCPNCSASVAVPEELLTRGVSRIHCPKCNFGFVMRLGDPNAKKANKAADRDPLAPVVIEGVTSSGSTTETAGEIGQGRGRGFIPTQTRSSIKLSPELMAMIAEDEARLQKTGSEGTAADSDEPPEASAPNAEQSAQNAEQSVPVANAKDKNVSLPAPLPPPPKPGIKQLAVLSIPTALDVTETTSASAPAPAPAPEAPKSKAPAPATPQTKTATPAPPQDAGTAPWPTAPSHPKATQSPQSAGTTPWPAAPSQPSPPPPQTPASPASTASPPPRVS
ncbi:MAG: hypothetical protein KAI47_26570, partial [Deltaproteobacteria bacterium]|nr:hypothetical protein [Deltaproteobacteria bacterium]